MDFTNAKKDIELLIKHNEEGINKILEVLDIDNIDETLYPNTKFINVRMK